MCTFSIPFTENVEAMIEKVKLSILKVELAQFDGTKNLGTFSLPSPLGTINGSYTIQDTTATFIIKNKPMLVPCSLIESKLNTLLNPQI